MKKAFELSTLTGTQALLLIASETVRPFTYFLILTRFYYCSSILHREIFQ